MVENHVDEFRGDIDAIYLMGTTNINHYLIRKRMLLQNALAAPINNNQLITYFIHVCYLLRIQSSTKSNIP